MIRQTKEMDTNAGSDGFGTVFGDSSCDSARVRGVGSFGKFNLPPLDEAVRVSATMPAELARQENTGIAQQKNTESLADAVTYTELPGQLPVQLPDELPAADDEFFDNEIYRIELEFELADERTNVQVRLRAKGPFRYSIMVGNYYIGKLTKRQLARAKNKTLPASIKRAIKEGNLDDDLIYCILARRGKGESGDAAKSQGQQKGIRGSRLRESARTSREAGPGHVATTGRRKPAGNFRGVTQSQRIN
jgi:hypothetical protein